MKCRKMMRKIIDEWIDMAKELGREIPAPSATVIV